MYGNNIGPEGAKALAPALVRASLTKISLAQNKLEEEGVKVLCEALKGHETLKELDLSGVPYGDSNMGGSAGAKHVADMLSVCPSLTRVDVSWNSMEAEGVKLLRDAVSGREGFVLIDHENT